MAQFSQFYLTNLGKSLIAQAQGDTDKLIFTKMVTSDKQYTENQIPLLTKIEQIKQQKGIGGIKYIPPDVVEINTLIDGMDVTAGYYIMSVAVFAKTEQENEEKLFAVCFILDNSKADWMSPNGSLNQMSINITARFITGNAQVTSITTVPDGTVSIDVFNQHTNDKNAHGATSESNINTIISRNELGYSKIKSPNYEEAEDEHIMNKKSTTEAINNKTSTLATKNELQTELDKKQNKLTAGTNIEITEDNIINATGGGTSIEISQDVETDKLNTDKVPSTKAVYDFMSWIPKDIKTNEEFNTGRTIDGKPIYGIYLPYQTSFNTNDKDIFYIPVSMAGEFIGLQYEYVLSFSCFSKTNGDEEIKAKSISFGNGTNISNLNMIENNFSMFNGFIFYTKKKLTSMGGESVKQLSYKSQVKYNFNKNNPVCSDDNSDNDVYKCIKDVTINDTDHIEGNDKLIPKEPELSNNFKKKTIINKDNTYNYNNQQYMCRETSFYYENISECNSVLVAPTTANVGTEFYYNGLKYRVRQAYNYYNGYANIDNSRFQGNWERVYDMSPEFHCNDQLNIRSSYIKCNNRKYTFVETASGQIINLDHCTWELKPTANEYGQTTVRRDGNSLIFTKGAVAGSFNITYTKPDYLPRVLSLKISR